ncbi:hypothetical protein PN456_19220 [Nodularia spumigena CS-586/05]|uniref:VMAP-C domain-containing protein n=1 Tax=Nodularia spumigena TaxID=70799 RepID=UPI00232B197E|nr:hypothetical protein [Nodularia spumigena]MDB9371051.1 hypothetical protein [Nodularia spumigena CS-586/05]
MLLSVPIKPKDKGFNELINALENCPSVKDPQKRKDIIDFLDDIGKQVNERNDLRASVISILKALNGFPNRFDELIDAINCYEQNNNYYAILIKVVSDIATEQQKLKCRPTKKMITLFEEKGVESENTGYDDVFTSLWSELCSILNEIDWKYIWEGCSKIKEINKNEDDKIYIKSLCFTKNYELLKRVFFNQYSPILLLIQLGESLKPYNQKLELWLKDIHESGEIKTETTQNNKENIFSFSPILLIIIDRLGDGQDQDKWNVRGQLKLQDKISEISLSKNQNGVDCPNFENIPTVIKKYINYLEKEPQYRDEKIDELRIEVFIPIFDLNSSLDSWSIIGERGEYTSLVEKYRLFLRSRERMRKNSRIGSLRKGWDKIDIFLKSNCQEISKTTMAKNIRDTQASNIIEILEDTQISNWIELEIFMKNCSILWGIRLKNSLSIDKFERMKFFESIFDSGIPIAFWNWYNIPSQVKFEEEFTEFLCLDNLSKRCCGLLEKTWDLRRVLWGARTETERKQYAGYYLGMLLEDPEILPEENPLQTIGVNK